MFDFKVHQRSGTISYTQEEKIKTVAIVFIYYVRVLGNWNLNPGYYFSFALLY